MSLYRLDRMFAPRSVVLIGASPRVGSLGRAILSNLRKARFDGPIGVVNPKYADIDGMPTVADIAALSYVPDVVVISAPAGEVPAIVAAAAARGVAGAVIISGGLGHGAGSLSQQAEAAARGHGLRLIGPNCLGIMSPKVRLNASFSAAMPPAGDLALISQSGAIVAALVGWASSRSIGFSGIASIGDQIDVDVADLLDYFALDTTTRAILLYIEGVKDARKFMSAARAAARMKPVIVVKSGRFAEGARAAATHTGALAGSDEVHDAAFRRAGLVRVAGLPELFDCAETLGHVSAPAGRRLAILTNGGGLGVLAVDRLIALGGSPATLSQHTLSDLDAILPPAWSKANPIDIIGDANGERYSRSLEVLLDDPAIDAVLVINVATAVASPVETATAVASLVRSRKGAGSVKPILAAWVGSGEDGAISDILNHAGVPDYPTEDDAVRGFVHLVRHGEALRSLMAVPPSLPSGFQPDLERARRIVAHAAEEDRTLLDPIEAAGLLQAFAIPVVETILAENEQEVASCAERLLRSHKAVVVKILSRDISHKSDIDGVRVGLTSAANAGQAAAEILERARRLRPEAHISGLIVQPMIEAGQARELIAGIADDPTFGPVVMFGAGGTAVEVVNDKALALPPLDLNLAEDLVGRPRVARLLPAYRNVAAVKPGAIAFALVKLSHLAAYLPEIREVDINPLLADEKGVLALDARITIGPVARKFAGSGHPRFAVRPYPVEWERRLALPGMNVLVRPLRPEDAPLLNPFLARTTPEDLRLRFFAPVKEFGAPFLARMTQLDYARAMAFAAIDEANGDLLGVVRLHADSQYRTAEYAILVRSDLKGRGLGWKLMELIIEYARSEGLRRLTGQVLQENSTMVKMCRELGFDVSSNEHDTGMYTVSMTL
jgi:acetyltransferase